MTTSSSSDFSSDTDSSITSSSSSSSRSYLESELENSPFRHLSRANEIGRSLRDSHSIVNGTNELNELNELSETKNESSGYTLNEFRGDQKRKELSEILNSLLVKRKENKSLGSPEGGGETIVSGSWVSRRCRGGVMNTERNGCVDQLGFQFRDDSLYILMSNILPRVSDSELHSIGLKRI